MHDLVHHGPFSALTVITATYVIFAGQMFLQLPKGWGKVQGARSVMALVCVFVLCALSGYTSSMLPLEYQGVRDWLHYALASVSVWLVLSNQAAFIAKLMRSDGDN